MEEGDQGMTPAQRRQGMCVLLDARDDALLCREVEAAVHATATSAVEYCDLLRRARFNMGANAALVDAGLIVHGGDAAQARGTLLERIELEAAARRERFNNMLQEKYEALNDRSYTAIVRCRRCGSEDVTWDEKQTRSADEAATLFCTCIKCKNRWVLR